MNVEEILRHLDELFAEQKLTEVEPYLTSQLDEAYSKQDYSTCITIMNELIGFFRDTSQYEKSLEYCAQVLNLMKELGYEGTIPYATTVLNTANALRAAGHHKESLAFYESIFPIYEKHLEATDERFASLYNNMSLLYQEMQEYEKAVACLKKALDIVIMGEDIIRVAITHTNLGASLLQLGKTEQAIQHLKTALAIFDQSEEKDFHYNAAVAAMAQAFVVIGNPQKAREYYLIALSEQQKHCGKSEGFYRILENLHTVEKALGVALTPEPDDDAFDMQTAECKALARNKKEALEAAHMSGLDLAQAFFEQEAKEALHKEFPEYVERMAIGLVGEGSECLGFDDVFSTDHDFGPGFCIWLEKDVYHKIAKKLQAWYDKLPDTFMGYSKNTVNGAGRTGVWCIEDFFKRYIGYADPIDVPDMQAFLNIADEDMATILNGRIFCDPSGAFEERRLAFYYSFTEEMWQRKIAGALIELGKFGQYNYPRAMKRGDYVTAQIILYKYIEKLLQLVHYVNHVFPPYYKWLRESASRQDRLAVLADLSLALADFADGRAAWKEEESGATDKIVATIEIIAALIIEELTKEGIFGGLDIPKEETFLEVYGKKLYAKLLAMPKRELSQLSDRRNLDKNSKNELIEHIVSLEWQAFDEVQNMGGRADCQDDWGTFSIMRRSQYQAWPKQMLISFIRDFRAANRRRWNLITEKYGRMMEHTDPEGFDTIKDRLPVLTEKQVQIIEQIVKLQVAWMEDFAKRYPNMASNSRTIHSEEDTLLQTSYETYLRGELATYGEETLKLYGNFIIHLSASNRNLAEMIMANTAVLYGYASLEDAEEKLAALTDEAQKTDTMKAEK